MQPKVSVEPGHVIAETDHIHVYAEYEVIYPLDDLTVIPVIDLIEVGSYAHVAYIEADSIPVVSSVYVSDRTGPPESHITVEASYVSGVVGEVSIEVEDGATEPDASWEVQSTTLTDSPMFDILSAGAIALVEYIHAIAIQTGVELLQLTERIELTDEQVILWFIGRDFSETITPTDTDFLAELGIILTPLFDSVTATEVIELDPIIGLPEQFVFARDSVPIALQEQGINDYAVHDEFRVGGEEAFLKSFVIDLDKPLSDSEVPVDGAPAFDIDKPDLVDSVTPIEVLVSGWNLSREFGGRGVHDRAVNGLPVNEGDQDIEGVYATAKITDYRWNLGLESNNVWASDEIYTGQVNADLLHTLGLHESKGPTVQVFKDIFSVLTTASNVPSDAIDTFNFTKVLTESQPQSDAIDSFDVGKVLTTASNVPTDAAEYDVGKTLTDSQSPQNDAIDSFNVGKVLATASNIPSEAIDSFNVTKVLTESQAQSDTDEKSVTKILTTASNVPADAVDSFSIGKVLDDSQSQTDAIDSFDVGKTLTDSQSTAESDTKSVTHIETDSSAPSDADFLAGFDILRNFFNVVDSAINGIGVHTFEVNGNAESDVVFATEEIDLLFGFDRIRPVNDQPVNGDWIN